MPWPQATEYCEAVQNTRSCFRDIELQQGQPECTSLGLPRNYSGNFADVYQIRCPNGAIWAVKCFTREVPQLHDRYQEVSKLLNQTRFEFTVPFQYFDEGIRIRGQWFPIVKMQWVQGKTLNAFVGENADNPQLLQALLRMWTKLAQQLRKANIAHADLQHGNVLLVPGKTANSVSLRLIDYDGMIVPRLLNKPSGELGHPAYQHPKRFQQGTYSLDVDRFSHLVICCALSCLAEGGRDLWHRHENGDNLLFRQEDFVDPSSSDLFRELWRLPNVAAHAYVGHLLVACRSKAHEVVLVEHAGEIQTFEEQAIDREFRLSSIPVTQQRKLPVTSSANPNPWWSDSSVRRVCQECGELHESTMCPLNVIYIECADCKALHVSPECPICARCNSSETAKLIRLYVQCPACGRLHITPECPSCSQNATHSSSSNSVGRRITESICAFVFGTFVGVALGVVHWGLMQVMSALVDVQRLETLLLLTIGVWYIVGCLVASMSRGSDVFRLSLVVSFTFFGCIFALIAVNLGWIRAGYLIGVVIGMSVSILVFNQRALP